ncbi:MAG: ThiF family adenylyltransferase [Nitrospiraceae bacterium]|nr:ThiF family adenylyltransferase [Nitrospiraceae bacterium]
MTPPFDYFQAFSRNIGWVTRQEQERLRKKRVAIAGMGGVGGVHLLTLARLGIGGFNISDLDVFELVNFNRQAGAMMPTLDQPKAETLARMALDINPELDIKIFSQGISRANVEAFLSGADLYVDGMDFFAFEAREAIFSTCHRLRIPATTAGPLGMSAALLNFLPGRMSFEDYFCWEGQDEEEKSIRFLLGLSPARLQFPYLVDPTAVNLSERRGPSTGMACQLCAGMAATEALKILLGRGKVLSAPWGMQFDAYRNRFVTTWRPGGNRNPIQKIALKMARWKLESLKTK